jgi:hypothetical protein
VRCPCYGGKLNRISTAFPGSAAARLDREFLALLDGSGASAVVAEHYRDALDDPDMIARTARLYGRFDELATAAPDDPRISGLARDFAAAVPPEAVVRSRHGRRPTVGGSVPAGPPGSAGRGPPAGLPDLDGSRAQVLRVLATVAAARSKARILAVSAATHAVPVNVGCTARLRVDCVRADELRDALRGIQAAAREFVTQMEHFCRYRRWEDDWVSTFRFLDEALGAFRALVGVQLAHIVDRFGLKVDGDLARILD